MIRNSKFLFIPKYLSQYNPKTDRISRYSEPKCNLVSSENSNSIRCFSQQTSTSDSIKEKCHPLATNQQSTNVFDNGCSVTNKTKGLIKNASLPDLEKHLNDATSYVELNACDQVPWPSSSFHQSEAEVILQKSRERKEHIRSLSTIVDDPNQVDHRHSSVLLFPGQGAQFVGMGAKLLHIPSVKELYNTASEILEYDLLSLCLEGPPEKLNSTRYCQPAIVVTSLAAVEALYQKDPEMVKSCIATAGFSVGEITALIFGGVLSLEDGLRLVKARGEAMEYASQLEPSGMMTVFFGAKNQLGLACEAARKWTDENMHVGPHRKAVCQTANYLYSGAKTLAGHEQALRFVEENKNDFGIRKVKWLPVSGAFHTPLMQEAVQPFRETLSMVKLNAPRISIYSNLHGEEYKNVMQISNTLPKQIVSAVKWEQIMKKTYNYTADAYYPKTYECGPGSSLSYILNKCNGKAGKLSSCTEV